MSPPRRPPVATMTARHLGVLLLGVFALGGCGGEATCPADAAQDGCQVSADLRGVHYVQAGTSTHAASPTQGAELHGCDSTGCDTGATGPGQPRLVRVWVFDGFDRSEVVGLRDSDGSFRVLIADTVTPAERADLVAGLAG